MKWKILALVVVYILTCNSHCDCDSRDRVTGDGNLVKEERPVNGITGIKTTTFVDVKVKFGDEEKLVLEAEKNLHQYIITEVRRGLLVIKKEPFVRIRSRRRATAYVTVKKLDTLIATSAGDITAPSIEADDFHITLSSAGNLDMENLKAEDVTIRVSSAGDVRMGDIRADTVRMSVSSAGDIKMGDLWADDLNVTLSSAGGISIAGGEVKTQQVRLSSTGSYRAGSLKSTRATVRTSSAGSASIKVSDYLKATCSSSGSIYYSGNPRIDKRRTSSGRIRQR